MSFPFRLRLACLAATAVLLSHPGGAKAALPAPLAAAAQRFSVTVTGQGPDVILIPGLASSAHDWDDIAAQLAPHYRLHILQIAGFAGAPAGPNASGPLLEPVMEALHGYIATNHLRAPAVIGHSLGGLIGMRLAIAHPDDVGRLMIVDSLPFIGLLGGPQMTVETTAPMAKAMHDRVAMATQESYAASEAQIMAKLVKSTDAAADAAKAAAAASDHMVVAQAMLDDMSTDVRADLPKITQPALILYPWDATSGIPQAAADGVYQSAFAAMPHATVKRIDGSYHFIMIDQPASFLAAVEGFLKGQ